MTLFLFSKKSLRGWSGIKVKCNILLHTLCVSTFIPHPHLLQVACLSHPGRQSLSERPLRVLHIFQTTQKNQAHWLKELQKTEKKNTEQQDDFSCSMTKHPLQIELTSHVVKVHLHPPSVGNIYIYMSTSALPQSPRSKPYLNPCPIRLAPACSGLGVPPGSSAKVCSARIPPPPEVPAPRGALRASWRSAR